MLAHEHLANFVIGSRLLASTASTVMDSEFGSRSIRPEQRSDIFLSFTGASDLQLERMNVYFNHVSSRKCEQSGRNVSDLCLPLGQR